MSLTKNKITFSLLGIFLGIAILTIQQVHATGCPTNFVSEHIKNAKTALEGGNTEEVMNQLELAEEAIGMAAEESE
jgi:hypothetical protein